MEEIRDKIIDELRGNVSDEVVNEIQELIMQGKYRWAFADLQKIKESKDWQPTENFLHLLEKFWWTYANQNYNEKHNYNRTKR